MSANLHISPWLIPVDLEGGGGGGGGGGGLPAITSDVTLNVPTEFPTIKDALDWVRERVRLNGANVTIFVEDGTALAESVVLTNECLDYVTLSFGENITLDADAVPVSPLGYVVFVYLSDSKINIGNDSYCFFNVVGTTPTIFSYCERSEIHIENVVVGGLFVGAYAAKSSVSIKASTLSAVIGTMFESSNVRLTETEIYSQNACVKAIDNSSVAIVAGTYQSGDAPIIDAALSRVTLNSVLGSLTFSTSAAQNVISSEKADISGSVSSINTECTDEVIFNNGGTVAITVLLALNVGSNNPTLVRAAAGRTEIGVTAFGTSTGEIVNVQQGAIVQVRLGLGTLPFVFSGGYSQTPNVPTADGIIFA